MKRLVGTPAFLLFLFGSASVAAAQSPATVNGSVTDQQTGESLIGANVILAETGTSAPEVGAVTDFDGAFSLVGVGAGSFDLVVRFVGFEESRQSVDVAAGETYSFEIALRSSDVSLNTVVVTASRQEEKVLDAPASMSVLSAREVEEQATASMASTMRNVTGLDMSQTGADRYEIVLRGFNNAFSGSTFSLVD